MDQWSGPQVNPLCVLFRKLAAQQAIEGEACFEISAHFAEFDGRNALAQTEPASLGGPEQALQTTAKVRRLAYIRLGPNGFRAQYEDRRRGRKRGEESFVLFGLEINTGKHRASLSRSD
jgi:hypothetical protein